MSEIKAKLVESAAQLTAEGQPWEVVRNTVNGIEYNMYKNAPENLKALIDAGRNHGDNEFIIYQDERWTFNQFFAKVDALAYQLVNELGINAGDRVAIAMRNYPEWMVAFAAAASCGAVAVPLNSWGQAAELKYGITDSEAKAVFFDQQRFNYVADAITELGIKAVVARPDSAVEGSNCYEINALIEAAGDNRLADDSYSVDTEAPAMIMYTSGTTGNPKGAVSSHRNITQAIFNFELAAIVAAMSDPEPIGKMLERGYPPKVLLSVPLFHVSGCHSVFLLSLRAGRPVVIMYKWDTVEALETIEKERITMISAVPTMLMDMLESDRWNDFDTSSMFGFGAGGAAQPPRLSGMIYDKLPDSFPGTGYGMTESNASGFSTSGGAYKYKPKSAGIASPITEVKFVDENGNEVADGEAGEIYLKLPTIVENYWNKPDANDAFKEGWYATGDVGHLDEEGFLFITDRIKDMVIRGGENIYSAEVEAAVLTHEGIQEAAAFGVPHESLGEELALAVYLKEGVSLSETDIQAHIAGQIAKFKVPSFVYFENEPLPRNATLKILKKPLKEKYSA